MESTKQPAKLYPAELRERAVRMVREHASAHASEWAAMRSIAEKVAARLRRCGGGARPPVEAMIAFIDEHRRAYGVDRSVEGAAAGAPGRRFACRNPSGLGGECPDLRRAQGLAAARPRRDRHRPLHRRLLEPIGNILPAEAKVKFYAEQEFRAMAA